MTTVLDSAQLKIKFLYSATLEMVSSFHVICDPSHHHNCIDWYDQVLECVDPALIQKIKDFGVRFANWDYIMDLVDYCIDGSDEDGDDDFQSMIHRIATMDDDTFVYIFLGETLLGNRELAKSILADWRILLAQDLSELHKYISLSDAKDFLANISFYKAFILEVMDAYYHSYFKTRWEQNVSFYKSSVKREQALFQDADPMEYILSLHEDLSYKNGNICMKKESYFEVDTTTVDFIKIVFSTYTFPHLMLNIFENHLTLYHNLLLPNISTAFQSIATTTKVFGDSTRLAIIKILLKSATTTQSLAKLLNISSASVSQHLKILKEADVLVSRREKLNVYYELNQTALTEKVFALAEFLEIKP